MHEANIACIVQALVRADQTLRSQKLLNRFVSLLGQERLPRLFVDREVTCQFFIFLGHEFFLQLEPGNQLIDLDIQFGTFVRRTGNNQWRPGLVNQNRVDLIHDGKAEASLHLVLFVLRKIVTQVVETKLIIRAVRDIGQISFLFVSGQLPGMNNADRHAEKFIDRPHPVRIAPGEVVIDGHDMHRRACQRVEIGGQGRDECLALAGPHLGNIAFEQHHAADQLLIEMTQPEGTLRCFTHDGEGFGQDTRQFGAVGQPLLELRRLAAQLVVGQRLELRLHRQGPLDGLVVLSQQPLIAATEYFLQKISQSSSLIDQAIACVPPPKGGYCKGIG